MKSKIKIENPNNQVLAHLPADAADVFCLPTKSQHDFCMTNYDFFRDPVILNAANIVMIGYLSQEKVQEKFLRIVNALFPRFNSQIC